MAVLHLLGRLGFKRAVDVRDQVAPAVFIVFVFIGIQSRVFFLTVKVIIAFIIRVPFGVTGVIAIA